MDPRIKNLKSTTFFGRRFTRRQIADIQQTVATFPALSRKELAQTICEHLRWRTPTGGNRVAAALGLLQRLERAGILTNGIYFRNRGRVITGWCSVSH